MGSISQSSISLAVYRKIENRWMGFEHGETSRTVAIGWRWVISKEMDGDKANKQKKARKMGLKANWSEYQWKYYVWCSY